MDEFSFIKNYLPNYKPDSELLCGIGDDAAILRPQQGFDWHISTDMLVAGRHFFSDISADDLAYKILAVNVSDMAAMGAIPKYVLLSSALPELNELWLNNFQKSLLQTLEEYSIKLIGGDTVKGDYVFNITIIGQTPSGQALKRNGAKVGDDIWVSGKIGLAAAGLYFEEQCRKKSCGLKYILDNKLSLPESICNFSQDTISICLDKLLRPTPRVKLGVLLLNIAHSALDISDGLLQDLSHILESSNVSAIIDINKIPSLYELSLSDKYQQWILSGGDDYELIFTAAPDNEEHIKSISQIANIEVAKIGKIIDRDGNFLYKVFDNKNGHEIKQIYTGFNHFL